MKIRVSVRLKSGVLDPQGKAIEQAMHHMGVDTAQNVRAGKIIEFDVADNIEEAALTKICDKLLSNPVMENYTIEKIEDNKSATA